MLWQGYSNKKVSMGRATAMSLVELLVMHEDTPAVIEYLGHTGDSQLQSNDSDEAKNSSSSLDRDYLDNLQKARVFLNLDDLTDDILTCSRASKENHDEASHIIELVDDLSDRYIKQSKEVDRLHNAFSEAQAFSNLKVGYDQLEHLSFLSMRIGRIPPENIEPLKKSVGESTVVIHLGNDDKRIMVATSKKGRFALDTELKKFGFVQMELPKDFKGIPEEVLSTLESKLKEAENTLSKIEEERNNFRKTHKEKIYSLIRAFTVSVRILDVQSKLQSTAMVDRITGWVPQNQVKQFMADLDKLTDGRLMSRQYSPFEVPAVIEGKERVPVKLRHGKYVRAFERMVFSYGSPLYGTVDPTPFVALFFTILFGVMFGDAGQGLVFLIAGILMACGVIKVGGWNKFAPIFMGIGSTSMIMGLVTGEFFTNEEVLKPFALWVTGLFGEPRAPILKVMPSSDPNSIKIIFGIFGVTIALGFIINSVGLVINFVNKLSQHKIGSAIFGKTALSGALFFWYVVVFAIRLGFLGQSPCGFDWAFIGVTLFFSAFGEVFARRLDGITPAMEGGFGNTVISGCVEVLEVVSTYLSCTISFVRVGAFALAHAVLGFIINLMSEKAGLGGSLVMIIGNGIVLVLEGMIVAIQVIRLQYYEFFNKFFNETGSAFTPLVFKYKEA